MVLLVLASVLAPPAVVYSLEPLATVLAFAGPSPAAVAHVDLASCAAPQLGVFVAMMGTVVGAAVLVGAFVAVNLRYGVSSLPPLPSLFFACVIIYWPASQPASQPGRQAGRQAGNATEPD